MSEKTRGATYFTLFLTTLFWSLSFVAIKIALRGYSPTAVVSIRLFFVVIIFVTLFMLRYGVKGLPRKKDLPLFIFIGLMNPFLAFLLECESIVYISASLASVIASTAPLFMPLAAFLLLREKVSLFNILGLLLSFGGVCLIILGPGVEAEYTLPGLLMMLGSVLACVFYSIIARKLMFSYPALTVVTFQQVFGFILYIPLFLVREATFVFSPENFHMQSFIGILFLAVFPSCMSYYFYNAAIGKIGPTRSSAFVNLVPVMAAVASYFILAEPLGWVKVIGIGVVISGLFLSQGRKKATAEAEAVAPLVT